MKGRLQYIARELLRGCLPSPTEYQYHPLPSTRAVRLLELHPPVDNKIYCSLRSFEQSKAPPYHALSYTWGHPLNRSPTGHALKNPREIEFLRKGANQQSPLFEQIISKNSRCFPISCDGRRLLVTANLHDALHMLTRADVMKRGFPNSKYIWIDAICVDQDNVSERNAQVAMMAEIFQAAQSVIVWLGPEDEYTEDALTVINSISSLPESSWQSVKYTDSFEPHTSVAERANASSCTTHDL